MKMEDFTVRNKNIGIYATRKLADSLQEKADSMYISRSAYCARVLQQWVDSGETIKAEG